MIRYRSDAEDGAEESIHGGDGAHYLLGKRQIPYSGEREIQRSQCRKPYQGDGFEDDPDAYLEDNVFFVPVEARWDKIAAAAHKPEIGTTIDNAMRAIEADNKKLKNVLPKNYASPDLDKRVLGDVVDLFTNMDMGETEGNRDVLGRTYEYCIAQFAEKEGKGGGEFYTPSSIVNTLASILKPYSNCRVYHG